MLAVGVANGAGLISIGSMLGADAFDDHAVRAFAPAVLCFLVGMIAYGVGVFARWWVARATAERFNYEVQSITMTHVRFEDRAEPLLAQGKVSERKRLLDRAARFRRFAMWARVWSWAATLFGAVPAWTAGVAFVGWAIYSGALVKPSVTTPSAALCPPAASCRAR
jgi:hypothetical protein